ncbi:hypothetical protein Scep_021877 [Stephania cephalantha]|uniref:Uncharacterized protein n=1 Tax=Stephania cephalantha TaxID=152367 RepID=A0AAP0F9C2_9MAGN
MDDLASDDDSLNEEEEESVEECKLNFMEISHNCKAYDDKKAEKKVDVTFERSNEPQEDRKEDQPLVLVKPHPVPCIHVEYYTGVEEKEHFEIFYTADTFVLNVLDEIECFILEV